MAKADIIAALTPIAVMGVAKHETDIQLLDYNLPFYDCPSDLILYNDRMGHVLTVEDVRTAKRVLKELQEDAKRD